MGGRDDHRMPVTVEDCQRISGPFFHGTRAVLRAGEELRPGHASNFQQGRVFQQHLLHQRCGDGRVGRGAGCRARSGRYCGPHLRGGASGPFEDDPNVTDKKLPGNPTGSYRSRHPLRVVREVLGWPPHAPEVLGGMLASLALLREQGRDVIED
jgi:hypothetical protein